VDHAVVLEILTPGALGTQILSEEIG
jgi:hypothetical protein